MTGYQAYSLLPVVGAMPWVGAGRVTTLLAARVAASGVPELQLARDSEWFGLATSRVHAAAPAAGVP